MLQLPGIPAHAWLVFSAKDIGKGLELEVVDSNYLEMKKFFYYYGEKSVKDVYYGNFVPYTQLEKNYKTILQARKNYCNESAEKVTFEVTQEDEIIDSILE